MDTRLHRFFALTGTLATTACLNASASDRGYRWQVVARDSSYQIAIDTMQIDRRNYTLYTVWYRTDHAQTRLHNGKPFNRELVQSLLRCDNLSFKVLSVDMSMGGKLPVARQRTNAAEQPWRSVERGTIEEAAARAACDIGKRQATARVMR
jgi:hypothetical protein